MTDPAGDAQRRMWTVGDYPVIARHLRPISLETVSAIGIGAGDRVLDVGVGTGNAAIEAARLGASVTGIDLTPAQIDRARSRCAVEGVDVDLRVGDAQALDFPEASFDVVLSVMGMIFAPDPARAAGEMARVCSPGGTVAITSWARGSWTEGWRTRAAHLFPELPLSGPSPDDWGEPAEVLRRLADAGLDATVSQRPFAFEFSSPEMAVDVFVGAAGPFIQMLEVASGLGRRDEALRELRAAIDDANQSGDGTCRLLAPYLLAMARP